MKILTPTDIESPAVEAEIASPEMLAAYRRDVDALGVPHRANEALRRLMAAGGLATPVVCEGLRHVDPAVRVGCCKVLDHHMDESALPELIDNLTHPDEQVRAWALHALACDRCKEGACRPGEDQVVPLAAKMLLEDPSRRVRQMAAGMVGEAVHRSAAALSALEYALQHEPHPVVRKICSWYVRGGPRYLAIARQIEQKRGRTRRADARYNLPPAQSDSDSDSDSLLSPSVVRRWWSAVGGRWSAVGGRRSNKSLLTMISSSGLAHVLP